MSPTPFPLFQADFSTWTDMTAESTETLHCTIHPSSSEWAIETRDGTEQPLPIYLDLHKVEKIRVEIHAPNKRDPGQLLRIREQAFSLVSMLAGFPRGKKLGSRFRPSHHQAMLDAQGQPWSPQSARRGPLLPKMEIVFLEREGYGSWYDGAALQQSADELDYSDLELIMAMFEYLRCSGRAVISFPPSARWHEFLSHCTAEVENRMNCGEPFNAFRATHNNGENIDALISIREADQSVALESILDDLPGPTAASLRLARFVAWEWHYPRIQALITYSGLTTGEQGWELSNLQSRHLAYESWHPDCVGEGWEEWEVLVDDDRDEEMRWAKSYPCGIPSLKSPEWQRYMEKWGICAWTYYRG